jgi:hypothetical protein
MSRPVNFDPRAARAKTSVRSTVSRFTAIGTGPSWCSILSTAGFGFVFVLVLFS